MTFQQPPGQPIQRAASCRTARIPGGGCLYYSFPTAGAVLNQITVVAGYASPCSSVQLYLDGQLAGSSASNHCGYWEISLSQSPADGRHTLQVISDCAQRCITITVDGGLTPVPAPVILYPSGPISENAPLIQGTAQPGLTVRVCVDGKACQTVPVNTDGTWNWQYPGQLGVGDHVVTAVAVDSSGLESGLAYQFFDTQTAPSFSVTLTGAEEGNSFRTIGLMLDVASPSYPVTISYLMLPPGSSAPSAQEVLDYTGPSLEDGTAAKGSVVLTSGGLVTVDVSGRENAPAGALGLVDGYRYDVYVVADDGMEQSPVLSAANIRAMPFGGGRGTQQDPYRIHQLTTEEIQQSYPDLAAGRSPVGVDDTARLLRNIDAMQILYQDSSGKYGIRNSMALDYLLTSPIDLSGYVTANQGEGWQPLGFRGNENTPVYFSGSLTGAGDQTPIRRLTLIRSNLRQYEGLFAYGYNAIF